MSDRFFHSPDTPQPTSLTAIVVFALSLGGAMLCFLVIPSLVLLPFALWVRHGLASTCDTRGQRFADAAVKLCIGGPILGLVILILLPSTSGGGPSKRSVCAANLKGIVQAMNVYANDNNDAYPIVAFAPYSAGLNDVGAAAALTSETDTLRQYFNPPHRQAGSPQAILWQLVLRGDVSAKSFICGNDTYFRTAAETTNAAGQWYDNFQSAHQLSYSVAYPWKADGTVGKWWGGHLDTSIPIMADVNPEQGTGTPARNMTPAAKPAVFASWNSATHQGDGQNVAFGDNHVEFARSPDVGQSNDNIYAVSGAPSKGPAQYGGIPAGKTMPLLTADNAPFDIVMLPVRNATTGTH